MLDVRQVEMDEAPGVFVRAGVHHHRIEGLGTPPFGEHPVQIEGIRGNGEQVERQHRPGTDHQTVGGEGGGTHKIHDAQTLDILKR